MNDFAKSLPERVVKAYQETGLKPGKVAMYSREYHNGGLVVERACAIGVLAIQAGEMDRAEDGFYSSARAWKWFAEQIVEDKCNNYSATFFAIGFDEILRGKIPDDDPVSEMHRLGQEVGIAVRKAGLL